MRGVTNVPCGARALTHAMSPVLCRRVSTVAAGFGGGRGFPGQGGQTSDGGLILPGGGSGVSREFQEHLARNNPNAQRLIIPGAPNQGGPPQGAPGPGLLTPEGAGVGMDEDVIGESITTPTDPTRYRPPAGFMNQELMEDETAGMPPDVMLQRIQSGQGRWYSFAKMCNNLHKQNYGSQIIAEYTGVTPAEQNRWIVAGTVYESIKMSGQVPPEVLSVFDSPEAPALLEPFRFLEVGPRVACALYLVENRLGPDMCDVLARSMKEWERRVGEREGFSNHPGDVLAFKYLRDALETRREDEMAAKVDQGMRVAVTDTARGRLQQIMESKENLASFSSTAGIVDIATGESIAALTVLRLSEDELGYRCLPVAGTLDAATEADVSSAPRSTQDGPFGVFTLTGEGAGSTRWVALPQWNLLTRSAHPVALEVPNCAEVPAIITGTRAKTEDDRRRLTGPGLLVVESGRVAPEDISPSQYYLSPAAGSDRMYIYSGAELQQAGAGAIAAALFVARPPERANAKGPSTESANLLQL